MNLVLFEADEIGATIPGQDPRAEHVRRTLRLKEEDTFAAGIINGPMGRARLQVLTKLEMIIEFIPEKPASLAFPLLLIVGLTRPQIAKHIFRESASMGIEKLWFYPTELGEKSYLDSDFWQEKNYRTQLIKGAGQGVTTHLPEVKISESLHRVLSEIPADFERIALDNIRPVRSITPYQFQKNKIALLLGSERGLTEGERDHLENSGFVLLKMGERVLRTDTACIAGMTLVLSKLGKI
ncbi:MAG: RsmE family RNA methyltransferase [Candidatus Marinimicrobia bacterium]|nr:RsmE family RNA methyltransferase [Candidatus Neomarinimicrobiota bacterium]